ncbi:MAG: DNA (cytosine-5-)-methyltransferase [Lachnospiraceae bacterium]|nr:DNA (cytosine-5-)-methyltransferase [Lachnospiraceae bacterium]
MIIGEQNRTLRVFEAFAGIGAQATALKRIGINYEIVGISDWFTDAIICYDAIHRNEDDTIQIPDKAEQMEYLKQFQFSRDSVHPSRLELMDSDYLERLYVANKRAKNYGSITQIKGSDMPDTDLLVYSFPCQDLSTGGKGLGMKKGSGTRSGLLWEVERILSELSEENRLPEYLLLENVRNILAPVYKEDLSQWLLFLESLGYQNDECMVLNALDFGVPQERERAFIVSHLGSKLDISSRIQKMERKYDFHRFFRNDYTIEKYRNEADIAQLNKTPSREVMWRINGRELNENTTVRTITCNMDRTHCAALFPYTGAKGESYRRPTIREAFLLMGFTEEEYEKTTYLEYTYRKMNKLIGNSIVVDVLAEIFRVMFEGKY